MRDLPRDDVAGKRVRQFGRFVLSLFMRQSAYTRSRFVREWVKITGGVLIICLGLAGAAIAGTAHACTVTGERMQREVSFDVFAGCFIETDDGTFVPQSQWIQTNEERSG